MDTKSANVSTISGFAASVVSGSTCSHDFPSITVIWLNENNYPLRAKLVEVYLTAKWQDKYVIDAPPDRDSPSFANWKVGYAKIRISLWNSMEPQISSSLVYLATAK